MGKLAAYRWQESVLELYLYIQPQARQEGYDGLHDRCLKFRIAAAATDGKANGKLIKVLAKLFAVPKQSIRIVRGHTSRYKTVRVESPQKLPEWIASPE
jgi:uncharacterized protein (TIGR00251 family)